MSDYIVEMKHVTKRFPGVVANSNVSLAVKKGEIYALLGENGAGKSTLMSMLFGMYEPDEGKIFVRGKEVRLSSSSEAVALNIGMVHQHFKLVQNYTITENIVLGVEPIKKKFAFIPYVDIKNANVKIKELSEKYGLGVDPTQKIENVTVSTQQRVEILKMLYREAEILIFDEPTAVLTPQEIEYLLKTMEDLRAGGKTIILITHKLAEIKKIADRCAILYRGKLVKVLDVASTDTKQMASLMVGREFDNKLEKPPMNAGKTILEIKGLTVQNESKFEVVKDVSFSVRGGEIFAIAGVAGNGQVEIGDAITGLIKQSGGSVIFNGVDIVSFDIRKRIEAGIAYIPEDRQKYGLVLDYSLSANLAIKNYYKPPFSIKGILHHADFEEYAERLIEEFDIRCGQGSKTTLRSMSGGNQQKTIIAREIEMNADLLIFVQPTRGLDIGAISNIHQRILEERQAGKAILLISLELDEVMALADTIGVIYNGELLKIADASSLTAHEVGKYMMGVRE